ncbi:MAG: ROK family protein [Enterococcus sp.]
MIGSIEAGGTKLICAVAQEGNVNEIIEQLTLPTTTPAENVPAMIAFFKKHSVNALGVGSFGPIDIDQDSPTYGWITNTPKLPWKQFDFLGAIHAELAVPIFWTTDVNAAAFGELSFGAAKGLKNCVYLTVGTGIGGGVVLNGKVMEGKGHPEIGHLYINQKNDDPFQGVCPYHQNCLEGLASGPAIEKRTGQKAQKLTPADEVWQTTAYYLAQACVNYTLSFAPEKIILGGGVMKQAQLFPLIHQYYRELLNDYLPISNVEEFIVPCGLPDKSGILGGLALANTLVEGVSV